MNSSVVEGTGQFLCHSVSVNPSAVGHLADGALLLRSMGGVLTNAYHGLSVSNLNFPGAQGRFLSQTITSHPVFLRED